MIDTLVLILCRKRNEYVSKLQETLNFKTIDCSIIADNEIDSDLLRSTNFINMNRLGDIDLITAWEKSFYTINTKNYLNKYNYFYFIEDDVYTKNVNTIVELITYFNTFDSDFTSKEILPKEDIIEWPWWEKEKDHQKLFRYPHRSFNPLCKLSNKLLSSIFTFKEQYGKLFFHEILFASLCVNNNLIYHDYLYYPKISEYIGKINYRPEIDINTIHDNKIYHPVKKY